MFVQKRDCGYIGRRMLKMELPSRGQRRGPRRRLMDVLIEDVKILGIEE